MREARLQLAGPQPGPMAHPALLGIAHRGASGRLGACMRNGRAVTDIHGAAALPARGVLDNTHE